MLNQQKQQGFNIIELMIAMLLGTILLIGATSIYINTTQTFRITEGQSGMQENGRFALEFITRDLQRAGSMGCMSDLGWWLKGEGDIAGISDHIEVLVNDPSNLVQTVIDGLPLGGVESYDSSSLNIPVEFQNLVPVPKVGTDILILRGELGSQGILTQDFTGGAGDLQVSENVFKHNDIVMVTNCDEAHVFQITNTDPATGRLEHKTVGGSKNNSDNSIVFASEAKFGLPAESDKSYLKGDPISQIATVVYYIAEGPTGVSALYRGYNGRTPEEVVPYVESMKVLLGQNTDPNALPDFPITADRYVPGELVAPPAAPSTMPVGSNIAAARIALLVRSEDEFYAQDGDVREHDVFGTLLSFNDRYRRQVYTTMVVLRNRTGL